MKFTATDGLSEGIQKETIENARNLLLNGAAFELVRKFIHNITDENLQKIYDKVMAAKSIK